MPEYQWSRGCPGFTWRHVGTRSGYGWENHLWKRCPFRVGLAWIALGLVGALIGWGVTQ